VSALLALTALAGLLAVAAAFVALLTARLERMAGAVAVATGALALTGTLARGPALGGLLVLGGVALGAPAIAGAIVVGIDGRPPRTPRAWKLLFVLPLAVVVGAVVRAVPTEGLWGATSSWAARAEVVVDGSAGLLSFLALAASALAALLLARRREAT
jgi:hypothetical protein